MTENRTIEQTRSLDYLLEIGVEEMPARFLEPALKELNEKAKFRKID
jgi:glycyl-tRNA synthetase beta subunit